MRRRRVWRAAVEVKMKAIVHKFDLIEVRRAVNDFQDFADVVVGEFPCHLRIEVCQVPERAREKPSIAAQTLSARLALSSFGA